MTFFTTREVKEYAGFESTQMIDYLHREGIVSPSSNRKSGRGKKRQYTLGDIVVFKAVNRLLSSGLSVARLKKALIKLRKDFRYLRPETAIDRYLITDGSDVFLRDDPNAFVNLNRDGQMAFAFMIDIGQAKDEVVQLAIANGKIKA